MRFTKRERCWENPGRIVQTTNYEEAHWSREVIGIIIDRGNHGVSLEYPSKEGGFVWYF